MCVRPNSRYRHLLNDGGLFFSSPAANTYLNEITGGSAAFLS
jgi:hypothetical protein